MYSREEATLTRWVEAIQIPDGTRVVAPEGTQVLITQQLGGSFTVMTDRGVMLRIDETGADALGKEVPSTASEGTPADSASIEDLVWAQLEKCYDPEIPINIVDLGLVYDCRVNDLAEGGQRVEVKMSLTAPGCGMGPVLAEDVRNRVQEVAGVQEAHVEVVLDPPWNPNMMTEAARLDLGSI